MLLVLILLASCENRKYMDTRPPFNGEAQILGAWHGDYPVTELNRLPETQRENPVGFLGDPRTFKGVWDAFNPGKVLPAIDFKAHLIIYVRNTRFYNRLAISKIIVKDGLAEVLAMETRSALPIDTKVAMSMAVVARQGMTGLLCGDTVVLLPETSFE
jgi:hypothetical protein